MDPAQWHTKYVHSVRNDEFSHYWHNHSNDHLGQVCSARIERPISRYRGAWAFGLTACCGASLRHGLDLACFAFHIRVFRLEVGGI